MGEAQGMVERVARVIELALIRHGIPDGEHEGTLDDARAAIEAMREPSDEMIEDAWDSFDWGEAVDRIDRNIGAIKAPSPLQVWYAMIDVALAEQDE